jgi:microcystin degradation protein MlrC
MSRLVQLPLLVTGEMAVTDAEPARSLYARLPAIDTRPGILCASLLAGCPWTDSLSTGVSVVVSGTDPVAVEREAQSLAGAVWNSRTLFRVEEPAADTDEAISVAFRAAEGLPQRARPVFLSDSGDNTTAGAAGDSPFLLERLVAARAQGVLVAGITDPLAVRACAAAERGREIELVIGGKLDRSSARPLQARARVAGIMLAALEQGPSAVVSIGGIDVILQSSRVPFTRLCHFEEARIDLRHYRIVAVKLGYLYPELRDFASARVLALTPGFSDQRLDRLPYCRIRRPIFPLDPLPARPGGA